MRKSLKVVLTFLGSVAAFALTLIKLSLAKKIRVPISLAFGNSRLRDFLEKIPQPFDREDKVQTNRKSNCARRVSKNVQKQ
ncbi:MAG: hypothetical protein C0469_05390 [Cyanobacteria bacterium DS2.3.42]|nr:hypothetical protein [Cyanobacteria bacterium DS2.3.42]